MDQYNYLIILKDNLKHSAEKLNLRQEFIFQRDYNLKYTAKCVTEQLQYNVPKLLNTSPQSLDINPSIQRYNIKNKKQLENTITTKWNSINLDIMKNSQES